MDAKLVLLKEKLESYLKQASAIATEIQGLEQGDRTPHYDQIETPAHEAGQLLSRMIQAERMRELALQNFKDTRCPYCGCKCKVEIEYRRATSMDGPVELTEPVAKCRRCRRSFFPSACGTGA